MSQNPFLREAGPAITQETTRTAQELPSDAGLTHEIDDNTVAAASIDELVLAQMSQLAMALENGDLTATALEGTSSALIQALSKREMGNDKEKVRMQLYQSVERVATHLRDVIATIASYEFQLTVAQLELQRMIFVALAALAPIKAEQITRIIAIEPNINSLGQGTKWFELAMRSISETLVALNVELTTAFRRNQISMREWTAVSRYLEQVARDQYAAPAPNISAVASTPA